MTERRIQVQSNDDMERLYSQPAILSTANLGWQNIGLEYRREPASKMPEISTPWHILTFVTKAPKAPSVIRQFNGKRWADIAEIGDLVMIPAGEGYGVEWDTGGEFLNIAFNPQDFATTIEADRSLNQVSLIPQFAQTDPLIYQLALGLKSVVEAGATGQRLYAETLTQTLAVHLLQHYTTQKAAVKTYSDGLSQRKLNHILDYIQANLESDLSLQELAQLAQLSPHYFAHLFKQSMGIAPHKYVIQQRVQRAKTLLRQDEITIADVAYQVGFANQAHLNRHFKRLVGITPGTFRRG